MRCNYSKGTFFSKYFGISQDPITKDIIMIMPYYNSGDLICFITNNTHINWETKLRLLVEIISGLINIHGVDIVHRDLHSGNIFVNDEKHAVICDLGISRSAIKFSDDNDSENYGIIPYVAPEV